MMNKKAILGLLSASLFTSLSTEDLYSIPAPKVHENKEPVIDTSGNIFFRDEYKKYFTVFKYIDNLFYFEYRNPNKLLFVSKRKTINNAWSDFIKNYWYTNISLEFRKEFIHDLHNIK